MSKVAEFIVYSGWFLLLAVCFTSIITVITMAFHSTPVPEVLEKLAFTSAGFLFGSLPSLIKDLLLSKTGS